MHNLPCTELCHCGAEEDVCANTSSIPTEDEDDEVEDNDDDY